MDIIVDDTNILIDLANTGLITRCQQLDVTFVTTDMVISELRNSVQRHLVDEYIANGGLTVRKIENAELVNLVITYQQLHAATNLSPADVSVMLLAERLGCRLLTNDQKLLNQARQRGIEANGMLWLTDFMVEQQVVSPLSMIDYLQLLLSTNERAPRKLIMEHIQEYTNAITKKIDFY